MNFEIDLSMFVVGGLAFARILTFVMATPIIGMRNIPPLVKIALALWLAAAAVPSLAQWSAVVPTSAAGIALALTREFFVGLLLAFSLVMVFAGIQLAGQIVGVQIGFALVNVLDPQTQAQVSAVSQFYYLMAALLFVALDGPLLVIGGVVKSFGALPPSVPAGMNLGAVFALVRSMSGVFAAALQIAAPPVVALLLVSITMGIMGRTVPQLNVLVVGFPLKILVGLLVMTASMALFGDVVSSSLRDVHEQLAGVAVGLSAGR